MRRLPTIGKITFGVALSFVLIAPAFAQRAVHLSSTSVSKQKVRQLELSRRPVKGDFDIAFERRTLRVLVPYSRSLYFNDKGRERGVAAENVRDFERWINKKYAKELRKRPLTVLIYPTTRDKLLPEVVEGLGDIALGNLTVTKERLKTVDFVSPPDMSSMRELVVTGPKSPSITSVEDLSGKTVHVRKSSSYYESLEVLNRGFAREGKPIINLVLVPDALEDEDMMEMVNAGLLEIIVIDDWKARMWAQILPNIKVRDGVIVRESGRTGWATRKGSPKLEAEIVDFYNSYLKKENILAYRFKQHMSRIKQMKNATSESEWKRFEKILVLFRTFGEKYTFDPLMLAAQGFQESQLNQNAKSPVGAIGVMQVMPATGKELRVGDIHKIEANIHAGTKYMDNLMTKYFSEAHFTENDRTLFAFASYNCGPGNVAKMRQEAARRGLDPNVWFNNVEIVTAERIGMETTTYVRNIYKYYAAYKLQLEALEAAKKAREQVAPNTVK